MKNIKISTMVLGFAFVIYGYKSVIQDKSLGFVSIVILAALGFAFWKTLPKNVRR